MSYALGIGGSERQLSEMARALDPREFTPHVACFRDSGFRAEELRLAGVPILHLPVSSFDSWSAVRSAARLRDYLRAHAIRLVHTFDYPSASFAVPVARFSRVPAVLSSPRCHRDLVLGWHRRFAPFTDWLADGIVTNCEFVKRHLIVDEGVPEAKVHLCYNGLNASRFSTAPKRRMPPLAGASLVIGTVAALRREKGLDLLLDAFAGSGLEDVKLAIVGSGEELGALQAQAARLGLERRIVFQPAVDNVAEWLASLDIFVLPSRSEALSNSLMEAMAAGCAVIASDAGGNPELVIGQETGLLFNNGDALGLGERLRILAADPDLRRGLGAAAAARIRERFSVEDAARTLSRIYRSHL